MDKISRLCLHQALEHYVSPVTEMLTIEFVQFWSPIIDATKAGKDVVQHQFSHLYAKAIITVNSLVKDHTGRDLMKQGENKVTAEQIGSEVMAKKCDLSVLSTEDQRLLHACIKFILQFYQNFKICMSPGPDGTSSDDDMYNHNTPKQLFVNILKCPTLPKDCIFLTATCLSFHLSFYKDNAKTAQEFLEIYATFTLKDSYQGINPETGAEIINSVLSVENDKTIMKVNSSAYLARCALDKATVSSDQLAQIALINGMLACSDASHLWQIARGIITLKFVTEAYY